MYKQFALFQVIFLSLSEDSAMEACMVPASVEQNDHNVELNNALKVLQKNPHAFHQACKDGDVRLAELLLEAGSLLLARKYHIRFPCNVLVNTKIRGGSTPLHIAVAKRNLEIIKLLLERSAWINAQDRDGNTPLHLALFFSDDLDYEIVSLLIKKIPNLDKRNNLGNSPLHFACAFAKQNSAQLLIEHGAMVNLQSLYGLTPLHLAVQENLIELVEFLLKHGAKMHITNHEGKTPLFYAQGSNGMLKNFLLHGFFPPQWQNSQNDLESRRSKTVHSLKELCFDQIVFHPGCLNQDGPLPEDLISDFFDYLEPEWIKSKEVDFLKNKTLVDFYCDRHLYCFKQLLIKERTNQEMCKIGHEIIKANSVNDLPKDLQHMIKESFLNQ